VWAIRLRWATDRAIELHTLSLSSDPLQQDGDAQAGRAAHRGHAVPAGAAFQIVDSLLDGEKADVPGSVVRTRGYRLRLPAPRSELVVARTPGTASTTSCSYRRRPTRTRRPLSGRYARRPS
jgi:hypothetical protein